jgi:hypothetical protein
MTSDKDKIIQDQTIDTPEDRKKLANIFEQMRSRNKRACDIINYLGISCKYNDEVGDHAPGLRAWRLVEILTNMTDTQLDEMVSKLKLKAFW